MSRKIANRLSGFYDLCEGMHSNGKVMSKAI